MIRVWILVGGNSPPREGSTSEQPPPPSHPPPHDNHHDHWARLWGPPLSNWPTAATNPFGQARYYQHDQVRLWGPPLSNWPTAARNPFGRRPMPTPCVETRKEKTIKVGVRLKEESLRVEKDCDNPGNHLVAFSFDATASGRWFSKSQLEKVVLPSFDYDAIWPFGIGSITIFFFAKEVENFQLMTLKENMLPPITFQFKAGVGQKYKQASGSGIDLSMFEESELVKEGVTGSYPLVVKMETHPPQETDSSGNTVTQKSTYSRINQALFVKENDVYHVKVVKQLMWVNEKRYEFVEIYGSEISERGKCVICLSEARNTILLPCRHMCMCMGCANVLISETRPCCPVCRQLVNQLFETEV